MVEGWSLLVEQGNEAVKNDYMSGMCVFRMTPVAEMHANTCMYLQVRLQRLRFLVVGVPQGTYSH